MSQSAHDRAVQAAIQQTAQTAARRRAHLADLSKRTAAFVAVFLFALLFIFPIFWMVITALKQSREVFQVYHPEKPGVRREQWAKAGARRILRPLW